MPSALPPSLKGPLALRAPVSLGRTLPLRRSGVPWESARAPSLWCPLGVRSRSALRPLDAFGAASSAGHGIQFARGSSGDRRASRTRRRSAPAAPAMAQTTLGAQILAAVARAESAALEPAPRDGASGVGGLCAARELLGRHDVRKPMPCQAQAHPAPSRVRRSIAAAVPFSRALRARARRRSRSGDPCPKVPLAPKARLRDQVRVAATSAPRSRARSEATPPRRSAPEDARRRQRLRRTTRARATLQERAGGQGRLASSRARSSAGMVTWPSLRSGEMVTPW